MTTLNDGNFACADNWFISRPPGSELYRHAMADSQAADFAFVDDASENLRRSTARNVRRESVGVEVEREECYDSSVKCGAHISAFHTFAANCDRSTKTSQRLEMALTLLHGCVKSKLTHHATETGVMRKRD
jgi:hypothetical protein